MSGFETWLRGLQLHIIRSQTKVIRDFQDSLSVVCPGARLILLYTALPDAHNAPPLTAVPERQRGPGIFKLGSSFCLFRPLRPSVSSALSKNFSVPVSDVQ